MITLLTPECSHVFSFTTHQPHSLKRRWILPSQLLPPSAEFPSKEGPSPLLMQTLGSGKLIRGPDYRGRRWGTGRAERTSCSTYIKRWKEGWSKATLGMEVTWKSRAWKMPSAALGANKIKQDNWGKKEVVSKSTTVGCVLDSTWYLLRNPRTEWNCTLGS